MLILSFYFCPVPRFSISRFIRVLVSCNPYISAFPSPMISLIQRENTLVSRYTRTVPVFILAPSRSGITFYRFHEWLLVIVYYYRMINAGEEGEEGSERERESLIFSFFFFFPLSR